MLKNCLLSTLFFIEMNKLTAINNDRKTMGPRPEIMMTAVINIKTRTIKASSQQRFLYCEAAAEGSDFKL